MRCAPACSAQVSKSSVSSNASRPATQCSCAARPDRYPEPVDPPGADLQAHRVADKTRHWIARLSTADFLFVGSWPTSMNAKADAGADDDDDEKHSALATQSAFPRWRAHTG